jgi:bifunctional non-homologous end joining protein LigD
MADKLATYKAKRRFDETPEPKGGRPTRGGNLYAIQKHAATRLHYDLRLELDGVLKSWAVTRGPSLDPAERRLAVRTEDHPVDYGDFEGIIPEGNYGAGTVLLWDKGTWEPIGDAHRGMERGKLEFVLHGERLRGRWTLVRMKPREREKGENWLLIKGHDEAVDTGMPVTETALTSVASGRSMEAIAGAPERTWTAGGAQPAPPAEARVAKPAGRTRKVAPLPTFVEPALATLVDEVPDGDGWVYEIKFDGYRALAAVAGGTVRIWTRNALDWTHKYPRIAEALSGLDLGAALLDGEIVVIDDAGRSDFGALQRALKGQGGALSFFVFDLLSLDGKDLRRKPLLERKEMLRTLLGEAGRQGPVFYTDHIEGDGASLLTALCGRGFEGIIAKRADARYASGRGRAWLKIKCGAAQEFVIVGWRPSSRGRPFSSILLGLHEGGVLRYAGRVGSGFSERELADLSARFARLARRTPAVEGEIPAAVRRDAHWLKPELVAHVEFAEFTADGLVRQGRFLGLREDKPAEAVVRERPAREAG